MVAVHLGALSGTASYTFPVAFASAPHEVDPSGVADHHFDDRRDRDRLFHDRRHHPGRILKTETINLELFMNTTIRNAIQAGLICLGLNLTACGTTGSNASLATATNPAAIEAALPLIRTGAAVATGAVLDFAVKQSGTRTRLANEMYAAANAVYSLSGGTFPTPAQFESSILAFGGIADGRELCAILDGDRGALRGLLSEAGDGRHEDGDRFAERDRGRHRGRDAGVCRHPSHRRGRPPRPRAFER